MTFPCPLASFTVLEPIRCTKSRRQLKNGLVFAAKCHLPKCHTECKRLGKLQRVGGHDGGGDDDVGRLCNCQNTQQPARRAHNLKILVRFYFCNSMSLADEGAHDGDDCKCKWDLAARLPVCADRVVLQLPANPFMASSFSQA